MDIHVPPKDTSTVCFNEKLFLSILYMLLVFILGIAIEEEQHASELYKQHIRSFS